MRKEAYELLEIEEQTLLTGNNIDFEIKGKFKAKVLEGLQKINKILEGKDPDTDKKIEDTNFDKLSKIDIEIQKMFSALFAYMKVMTQEARAKNESDEVSTIKQDMESMQANLKRSIKIDTRKNREGSENQSNAYQILGLPEQDSALSDEKVARKTLLHIKLRTPKKLLLTIEEIGNLLFMLQADMWAYSKLSTNQNRKNYKEELEYQRTSQDAAECEKSLGTLRREKNTTPISIPIYQTEQGEIFSVSEIGKLINREIFFDEGSIGQYALERTFAGKKEAVLFYSNIDMERLAEDPKYAQFVKEMLFSENGIHFAKRYLGGYVGEVRTKAVVIDGEQQEEFELVHNSKSAAMCRKYQRERIEQKKQNNLGEQPQGGETR